MKFEVTFILSESVKKAIYVREARTVNGASYAISDAQLAPTTRALIADGIGCVRHNTECRLALPGELAGNAEVLGPENYSTLHLRIEGYEHDPNELDAIAKLEEAIRLAHANRTDFDVAIERKQEEERAFSKKLDEQRTVEAAQREARLEAEAHEAQETEKYVAATVRLVGTQNQIARLAEALLPTEEAERIVRDHLFETLNSFTKYKKLTALDLATAEDLVSFYTGDAEGLDAEAYENLVAIREAAQADDVTARFHRAVDRAEDREVLRYSAKVTYLRGGRKWSREYAI